MRDAQALAPLFCYQAPDCTNGVDEVLWFDSEKGRAPMRCDSAEYWGVYVVGMLITVCILIGVPGYICFEMYMGVAVGLNGPEAWMFPEDQLDFKLKWSWIVARYRPALWWWEMKVLAHKIMISIVGTTLMYNSPNVGGAMLGIQFAAIAMHCYFLPFPDTTKPLAPDWRMNCWELFLLSVQLLNAFVAVWLTEGTEATVDVMSDRMQVLIGIANIIPFIALLPIIAVSLRFVFVQNTPEGQQTDSPPTPATSSTPPNDQEEGTSLNESGAEFLEHKAENLAKKVEKTIEDDVHRLTEGMIHAEQDVLEVLRRAWNAPLRKDWEL
jgi:hypothetical protein